MEVWQRARSFARSIYALTQQGSFWRDFKLKDQINSATESITSNIAEGFERDGAKEFIQFLSVSKGSSGEARSQLYTALDRNHIPLDVFEKLNEEALIIGKQLAGLMIYLKRSDYRGLKYVKEPCEIYLPEASSGNPESEITNKESEI